jgi:hypothetical protein
MNKLKKKLALNFQPEQKLFTHYKFISLIFVPCLHITPMQTLKNQFIYGLKGIKNLTEPYDLAAS